MSRDDADPARALPMIVAQSEMRPRERLIWADRPGRANVRRVADQIERARRAAREESGASVERSESHAPDQG